MNNPEHVFPLSDSAQHTLDEVKEEIVHPISRRMRRVAGANVWTAIVVSVAVGAVCGFALGRRD